LPNRPSIFRSLLIVATPQCKYWPYKAPAFLSRARARARAFSLFLPPQAHDAVPGSWPTAKSLGNVSCFLSLCLPLLLSLSRYHHSRTTRCNNYQLPTPLSFCLASLSLSFAAPTRFLSPLTTEERRLSLYPYSYINVMRNC